MSINFKFPVYLLWLSCVGIQLDVFGSTKENFLIDNWHFSIFISFQTSTFVCLWFLFLFIMFFNLFHISSIYFREIQIGSYFKEQIYKVIETVLAGSIFYCYRNSYGCSLWKGCRGSSLYHVQGGEDFDTRQGSSRQMWIRPPHIDGQIIAQIKS